MTSTFLKVSTLLKVHWPGLVVAVLVGVVIIAPQLAFIQSLGSSYQGIYMLNTDAELHYVARMEAAVKGDGIGNPFVIDYRDEVPSGFYSYSETILAFPAKVLPLSVIDLSLFYKFLLPLILALLTYTFIFRLTRKRGWAAVAALALTLGSTALNAFTVKMLLTGNLFYQQFLLFSRPVNPIFTLIVFMVFLHIFLTALERKSWKWYAMLGILFGLSWYIYIYLGTTLIVLLGAYGFLSLLARDVRTAFYTALAGGLGLLVGLPGILSIAAIAKSPYYSLFVGPIGLAHTHMPYVHIPWLVVTALFLWYWYGHRDYPYARLFGSILLATLVVVNQQVITGLSLHPGHYLTYFCIPLYILVLCALGAETLENKSRRLAPILQILIATYVIVAASFIQYSSYVHWAPIVSLEQRYVPVLAWLGENTPTESVVMANPALSELIPAYTHDNVMWEVHANSYLIPAARWDFTPLNALAATDFCTFIKSYRLDYVVVDIQDADWARLARQKCLRPVATLPGFTIYQTQ